jgi:hypothetical protein
MQAKWLGRENWTILFSFKACKVVLTLVNTMSRR